MKKIDDFWDQQSKFVFLISVILMIIAHGFCFMNLMYSHDSLKFYETSGIDKIALGRWLYPLFVHVRQIATPWMMGILSTIYVAIAVVLVTKILDFNKLQSVCVAMLFSSSITLTALFCTYIFDADADCMAMLLACFAVYAFKSFPNGINIITSSTAIMFCLALYQAYICLTIGLFIAFLIIKSKEIKNWEDVLRVFIIGLKEILTIILSIIMYISMMHLVANHYGVRLSTKYNGAGKLSSLTFDTVLKAIPEAYSYFRDTFFNVTGYNRQSMVYVYYFMVFVLLLSFVVYIRTNKPFIGAIIIIIPCIILMPLALNAIFLVSFGAIHQLMIFAFCLVLLLPFIFTNITAEPVSYGRKIVNCIAALSISFICFNNIVYSNGAYTYKKLVYDNTALNAQTIWKDVNSTKGYTNGVTPVVLMGEFGSSRAAYNSSVGDRFNDALTGASKSSMTYHKSVRKYFYGILGRDMKLKYNDPNIRRNKKYIDMPAYPSKGYCEMINGKVVVKLN